MPFEVFEEQWLSLAMNPELSGFPVGGGESHTSPKVNGVAAKGVREFVEFTGVPRDGGKRGHVRLSRLKNIRPSLI
jgi:hypothetical protein